MLASGCATTTVRGSWLSVANENTREAYERFIEKYPNAEEAQEARKRIGDPDYAFLATCRIGTHKAFEGFLGSYPSTSYGSAARAYLEFLKETRPGDLKSYKQFAVRHPNHPFAALAKVSVPVLWLKETGRKIGVIVNIGELTDNKGILGGGYGDAEKTRQRVSEALKKDLENEGVVAVLLDDLQSDRVTKEAIGAIIVTNYSESQPPPTPPPITAGPYTSPLANALHWSAVESLSNLIWNPAVQVVSISVKGVNDEVEYYSGFHSLSSSKGSVNKAEALKAIGNYSGSAGAMVALQEVRLSSPEEKTDEELLEQLKSRREGE